MNKYFLSIIFCSLVITVSAQSKSDIIRLLVTKIVNEMNAVIEDDIEKPNQPTLIFAKPPSYFDINQIVLSTKNIANKYSDVNIIGAWKKNDNGNYECKIRIGDISENKVLIIYYPEENGVLFTFNNSN